MPRPITTDHEYPDAESFLAALRPTDQLWGTTPGDWIFRGQADENWRLTPKAHRPTIDVPWHADHEVGVAVEAIKSGGGRQPSSQTQREIDLLRRFALCANRIGLVVPGHLAHYSDSAMFGCVWPDNEYVPLLALAQHYGVPTRLLDWTRRGRNAAYFAATPRTPEPLHQGRIVVWAFKKSFLQVRGSIGVDGITSQIVELAEAGNSNLNAQAGLFTLTRDDNTGGPLIFEEYLAKLAEGSPGIQGSNILPRALDYELPVLRRLFLPRLQVPRLLRLLAYEGVTAAAMFPGYAGTATAIKEQFLWDDTPHDPQF